MATAGRVLMIPAGDWKTGSNYGMLDVVVHLGSSYVAKNDINNSTKAPPSDTTNWQLLAKGYDVTNLVTKDMVVNNFLTTVSGTVADGRALKTLKDLHDQQNSDMSTKFKYFECYYTSTGAAITPEATMLSGLKEIYAGIPNQCNFVLRASFSGTLVRLDGLKESDQYGKITTSSYADNANVTYSILNGVWTKK